MDGTVFGIDIHIDLELELEFDFDIDDIHVVLDLEDGRLTDDLFIYAVLILALISISI